MTPSPVTIRGGRRADETALRALERAVWSWEVTPGPPRTAESRWPSAAGGPGDVLVAEVDGAAVGYILLLPATPLESNRHVLEIGGLAVDPAHRGRGIGRRLLDAGCAEARSRGARRLRLRVLSPNVSARRLYAAAGFVVEGVLVEEFVRDGRYVDDMLMAFDLTRRGVGPPGSAARL